MLAASVLNVDNFIQLSQVLLIPLWQVLLFIVIISLAALFERYKLILILCYIFAIYWVFIENLKLLAVDQATVVSVLVFLVFGLLTLCLTIYYSVSDKD
jgi:hypothetical protein